MKEDIEGIETGLEWDFVIETLVNLNSGTLYMDKESGTIKGTAISHELNICFERIMKNKISTIPEREFKLLLEAFSTSLRKLEKNGEYNVKIFMECFTYSRDMLFLRKKYNLFEETKFESLSVLFALTMAKLQKEKMQESSGNYMNDEEAIAAIRKIAENMPEKKEVDLKPNISQSFLDYFK